VKRVFRSYNLIIAFLCLTGAVAFVAAQTADPFVAQITSSTRESFAGDISGNGRFVVIESTGNIATENPDNADGNREIFLFDYAQRRIFQITRTQSALKSPLPSPSATPSPTVTPTPSASPTPTPSPTPPSFDPNNIDVEVSNNRPVISFNGRWIAFTSNAPTPANFDGNTDANRAALRADGNQEVFLYFIPAAPNVDLTTGTEPAFVNLAGGEFTRITNTPASRLPLPGSTQSAPFVADDNRFPMVNDNASVIAFTSTRNLTGNGNPDANPELFVFNRTTGTTTQVTNTTGSLIFNENPSLSADGSRIAFVSNGNIPDVGSSAGNNGDNNAEIYFADFNGAAVTRIRQVTSTTAATPGVSVNLLSPGRRISRDGNFIAFESAANLTGDGSVQTANTVFLYNVPGNSFAQVGPRATSGGDLIRFPTFTGDSSRVVFVSILNFRADGSVPTTAADGLNPNNRPQLFSAPVSAPTTFTRLTDTPAPRVSLGVLQPFVSNTERRIAFSIPNTELGGGNLDNSYEAFYLLVPPIITTPSPQPAVSFSTGASNRDIVSPSPAPSPPAVAGAAPGMLVIARSATAQLAPSNQTATGASETRRPSLPIELNGVSVSVGGAAAGLYFVSPGQINFVVPIGLAPTTGTNTVPVVINNNGTVIRTAIAITAAQPDIFTSTDGAGGRARVFNVTDGVTMSPEPFTVTTAITNSQGQSQTVPTVLGIILTGVRGVQPSQVTVRIGTTDISGASILAVTQLDQPGFQQINVQLPASLAGAGDVPIIVTVTIGGQTFTSRPADSAPRIRIN
jgi:uncharacterized protein (TIGR03437 family)